MPKSYPCPSSVMDCNKHMGGVDLSVQLIQYFTTQHKTMEWYRKLFLSFLDIAAMNAYIIHNELASQRQQEALTHKAFMKELTAQLCGVSKKTSHKETPNTQVSCDHVPVPVTSQSSDVRRKRATPDQRQTCQLCRMNNGKQYKTSWKCQVCDVSLCLQLDRNCFEEWHKRP